MGSAPQRVAARVRAHPLVAAAIAAVLAGAALVAVLLLAPADEPPEPSLADAVPYDGRSPREPAGAGTRVIVALPRPALGETDLVAPAAQRRYVRSLERESAALRSALGARGVRLADVVPYARTFDGFAATVRTPSEVRPARSRVRTVAANPSNVRAYGTTSASRTPRAPSAERSAADSRSSERT